MKSLVLVLIALAACVTAVPTKSLGIDIYKNTLQRSNSRVIGGVEAERHQFPHLCSLEWGFLGAYSHICGCIAIKENWVLTAGHCKAYPIGSYRVVLGQLERGEEHEDVQVLDVIKFVVHPNYPGGVAPNDIGLLKLGTNIKPTEAVSISKLPTAEECSALSPEKAVLAGWGLINSIIPFPPKKAHYTIVPVISNKECEDSLIGLIGESGPLDHTMRCTGSEEGSGKSACSGDSGGGLVTKETHTPIGIVSWGLSPCGTKGAPTVYTDPCAHLDFIKLVIN